MGKRSVQPLEAQRCQMCDNLTFADLASAGKEVMKPALLLHSCCGPCSTAVIERLWPDYDLTVFFYNPCITDLEEYEKRKASQILFIEQFNQRHAGLGRLHFIEGDYEPERYLEAVSGYSNEPEGGARCTICFRQRLEKTAKQARAKSFGLFTTTLTVSPHKNYPLISADKYGIQFLDIDFKKKAGFQRSIQLSKEYGLYRQNYCGCEYSKR